MRFVEDTEELRLFFIVVVVVYYIVLGEVSYLDCDMNGEVWSFVIWRSERRFVGEVGKVW